MNYRSFDDSGEIPFGAQATVVVGRNNVGKTGLIEAVNLMPGATHRSPTPRLLDNGLPDLQARVSLTVELAAEEIKEFLLGSRTAPLWLPIPNSLGGRTDHNTLEREAKRILDEYDQAIRRGTQVALSLRSGSSGQYVFAQFPELLDENAGYVCVAAGLDADGHLVKATNWGTMNNVDLDKQFGGQLGAWLKQRMYLFRASRLTAPTSNLSSSDILQPDLGNLPSVLLRLQRTPNRFRRYRDLVSKVLPEIRDLAIRQIGESGTFEILTYAVDPKFEDEQLAMSLAESGSGVSQVLGILYVAATSRVPQLITIDEPQSFLHPGAIRNLIEILRTEAPQHQYIIATHSSVALSAMAPERVLLLTRDASRTVVTGLDVSQRDKMSALLADLGARMSDIFGADRVLWVEGRTEEECFQIILRAMVRLPLIGTVILGLRSTGELEGRHADAIIDIYNRLSSGPSLLPMLVGFVLDRESRPDHVLEDLKKHAGGRMWFLSRRMFENFLLIPDAIADLLRTIDPQGQGRSSDEIRVWLESKAKEKRYGGVQVTFDDPQWPIEVHGARLLYDLFEELTDHRAPYDKVVHGKALTTWVAQKQPKELAELKELLTDVLFGQSEFQGASVHDDHVIGMSHS